VSFETAAILEPFTVGLNMMERVQPLVGEWVVVLGQGPICLGQTQMASLASARLWRWTFAARRWRWLASSALM
jgi:threonine dehydrogenase-like Zn-dependent dehydrogenase